MWWRYIDDIFVLRTDGKPTLCTFTENINCHHPSTKFTVSWSAKEVTFLDTRIYLKEDQIGTDLNVKPTNRQQFLHMDSCHPYHCKTAITYSQVLHLWWICSENEDFTKSRNFKNYPLKCGYNEHNLNHELQRALNTPRDTCLQSKRN